MIPWDKSIERFSTRFIGLLVFAQCLFMVFKVYFHSIFCWCSWHVYVCVDLCLKQAFLTTAQFCTNITHCALDAHAYCSLLPVCLDCCDGDLFETLEWFQLFLSVDFVTSMAICIANNDFYAQIQEKEVAELRSKITQLESEVNLFSYSK